MLPAGPLRGRRAGRGGPGAGVQRAVFAPQQLQLPGQPAARRLELDPLQQDLLGRGGQQPAQLPVLARLPAARLQRLPQLLHDRHRGAGLRAGVSGGAPRGAARSGPPGPVFPGPVRRPPRAALPPPPATLSPSATRHVLPRPVPALRSDLTHGRRAARSSRAPKPPAPLCRPLHFRPRFPPRPPGPARPGAAARTIRVPAARTCHRLPEAEPRGAAATNHFRTTPGGGANANPAPECVAPPPGGRGRREEAEPRGPSVPLLSAASAPRKHTATPRAPPPQAPPALNYGSTLDTSYFNTYQAEI